MCLSSMEWNGGERDSNPLKLGATCMLPYEKMRAVTRAK